MGFVGCKKRLQHSSSFCSCRRLVSPLNAAADFHTSKLPKKQIAKVYFWEKSNKTSIQTEDRGLKGFRNKMSEIRQVWGQEPKHGGCTGRRTKGTSILFSSTDREGGGSAQAWQENITCVRSGQDSPQSHVSSASLRAKTRASAAAAIAYTRVLYAGPPSRTKLDWKPI